MKKKKPKFYIAKKYRYVYEGPVFKDDEVYCQVLEYVYAYSYAQALLILQQRISKKKGLELWLKNFYIRRGDYYE